MGGIHESPWRQDGPTWQREHVDKGLERRDTLWVHLAQNRGGCSPRQRAWNVGVNAERPWGLTLGPDQVLWREGLPHGQTYGQVELILEIFVDQVKFTVTLNSTPILLGEKGPAGG